MAITDVSPARLANGAESNDLEDVTHTCVQCGTTLTRTIRPLPGDAHTLAGADFKVSHPEANAYEFRAVRSYTPNLSSGPRSTR